MIIMTQTALAKTMNNDSSRCILNTLRDQSIPKVQCHMYTWQGQADGSRGDESNVQVSNSRPVLFIISRL